MCEPFNDQVDGAKENARFHDIYTVRSEDVSAIHLSNAWWVNMYTSAKDLNAYPGLGEHDTLDPRKSSRTACTHREDVSVGRSSTPVLRSSEAQVYHPPSPNSMARTLTLILAQYTS